MARDADYLTVALFGLGSVLLLVAAGLLFTGNLGLVGYAVPVGLAGLAVVYFGVQRLDRRLDANV